jgi:hypothetical protein
MPRSRDALDIDSLNPTARSDWNAPVCTVKTTVSAEIKIHSRTPRCLSALVFSDDPDRFASARVRQNGATPGARAAHPGAAGAEQPARGS